MHNWYKNKNIFICTHDTHRHFSHKMSVFHIMEEKKCFPDGCVYFKWKCKSLAKKKKCHRNFTKVGRLCFSCNYFYEEKIHQYPQMISKNDFWDEYERFTEWIASVENKQVFCEGKISHVVPDFNIYSKNEKFSLELKGFLIIFKEGYINNQLLEDSFYLHLDGMLQNKLRLQTDDEVEFKSILKLVDGKLELFYPKRFDFYLRGNGKPLLRSDLIVSSKTATTFKHQPEKCRSCGFSVIPIIRNNENGQNRVLVCSKGVNNHDICLENVDKKDKFKDSCENDKFNSVNCSFTL